MYYVCCSSSTTCAVFAFGRHNATHRHTSSFIRSTDLLYKYSVAKRESRAIIRHSIPNASLGERFALWSAPTGLIKCLRVVSVHTNIQKHRNTETQIERERERTGGITSQCSAHRQLDAALIGKHLLCVWVKASCCLLPPGPIVCARKEPSTQPISADEQQSR